MNGWWFGRKSTPRAICVFWFLPPLSADESQQRKIPTAKEVRLDSAKIEAFATLLGERHHRTLFPCCRLLMAGFCRREPAFDRVLRRSMGKQGGELIATFASCF
jgi:hypothetical protein